MSLPVEKSMTTGEPDLTAYLHPAMVEMGLEVEEVAMADPGPQTGTEMNIGRSHGIGAGLPVAAVVEVVTTWGSEVPRTGVVLAMVTGMISGDHQGDHPGVLHLVTMGATTEAQFHQCRMGTAAKRGIGSPTILIILTQRMTPLQQGPFLLAIWS